MECLIQEDTVNVLVTGASIVIFLVCVTVVFTTLISMKPWKD